MLLDISQGVVARRAGQVSGTALFTPYGATDGTLSMIIVAAEMRGAGLGRRLVEAAMACAETRTLRLIATDDGAPLYRKLGFEDVNAIHQHQGVANSGLNFPADDIAPDIAPAQETDLNAVRTLDLQAYGADRTALLTHLYDIGVLRVVRNGGLVTGFAFRRAFGRGEVIGPVVARDQETARRLIGAQIAERSSDFIRVDIPGDSGLGPWLETLGLAHVGGGMAMTRPGVGAASSSTPAPDADPAAVTYALAAQALG